MIREGSFHSVRQLAKDIESYLAQRNLNPKPYKWKANGEQILRKIQRAKDALHVQPVFIQFIVESGNGSAYYCTPYFGNLPTSVNRDRFAQGIEGKSLAFSLEGKPQRVQLRGQRSVSLL